MKEQLTAGLGERQISELVEHDKVEAGQIISQTALPTTAGLALQSVDEIDNGIKSGPLHRRGCRLARWLSQDATCQYRCRRSARRCAARRESHRSPDRAPAPH